MPYDKDFLISKGFKFERDRDFDIADSGYLPLLYSTVTDQTGIAQKRDKMLQQNTFAATWIFVQSTGAIYVTRPAGENRLFVFNPAWSQKTEYVKGKLKLLEKSFSPDNFDELFDVKAVHNYFYDQLWEHRLALAQVLKENHKFSDKDAILIAQRIFDRIIFLYFCCESGIVSEVKEGEEFCPALGRAFFNYLLREDEICGSLNQIFFDYFAKPHDNLFKIKENEFNIPYLNGGLFQVERYINADQREITDQQFQFNQFNFKALFGLFNNYLWVIESRPPQDLEFKEIEYRGTLTPEILGHMYEKFVITIANLGNEEDPDAFDIKKLKKLVESREGNKRIGAYYTPEDVVQYILRKTLFPCILDRLNRNLNQNQPLKYGNFEQFWSDNKQNQELMKKFVDVLSSVRILDPAVGSGHFLLGVANELYRMSKLSVSTQDEYTLKYTIIVNTLYGVDLMPGAVEICKLRLWLWLMSTQFKTKDYPPLPNIEYKIRVGNSLLGLVGTEFKFARYQSDPTKTMLTPQELKIKLGKLTDDINEFKVTPDPDGRQSARIRQEREELLKLFNNAYFYEIRSKIKDFTPPTAAFHWGIDFFEVFNQSPGESGFDLIVGNPPYGNILSTNDKRILNALDFIDTNEICANFVEREVNLLKIGGYLGQILAGSMIPNSDLTKTRNLIQRQFGEFYLAYIGTRPSKIFEGVEIRVCIGHGQRKRGDFDHDGKILTSRGILFQADQRKNLFKNLQFHDATPFILGQKIGIKGTKDNLLPKVGDPQVAEILERLKLLVSGNVSNWGTLEKAISVVQLLPASKRATMQFRQSGGYWLNALKEFPYQTSKIKPIHFASVAERDFAILLINSHLMYLFWAAYGNFHDFKQSLINQIPFPSSKILAPLGDRISSMCERLCKDLLFNFRPSKTLKNQEDGKKGRDGEFQTGKSKGIIDEAEALIAEVYGFTKEQVNFLRNYDNHLRT